MAEFIPTGTRIGPEPEVNGSDGFAQMGKPIPSWRRTAALAHCRDMGLTDTARAMRVVDAVANQLERDEPYEAMASGMSTLDLTGTYRLMAVLLAAPKPRVRVRARLAAEG